MESAFGRRQMREGEIVMKYLITAFILLNISSAFAASKKCTEGIDQFSAISINNELQKQAAIIEATGFIEDQIRSGEI
jgi:hypothetical protein